MTKDMVDDSLEWSSASASAEEQLDKDDLWNDELHNVNPDSNQIIQKVDMLDEALEMWTDDLPPFIEDSIPHSVNPGDLMKVWRSSDRGGRPWTTEPNDFVIVAQWKDTNAKYFIWERDEDWRHIVKGNGHVNDGDWVPMLIWHGPKKGWTRKRQIWTKNETGGNLATFNPETVLKGVDGTVLGHTDRNHEFRRQARMLEDVEKRYSADFQPQQFTDTTTTRSTRLTAKRQREILPSPQLESLPSMNYSDAAESQPGSRKRQRVNAVSYTPFFPTEAPLDEDRKVIHAHLSEAPGSGGGASMSTSPETVTGRGVLKEVAPVAVMYSAGGPQDVDVSSSPPSSPPPEISLPENSGSGMCEDRVESIDMNERDHTKTVEQHSSLTEIGILRTPSDRHEHLSKSTAVVERNTTKSSRQISSTKAASVQLVAYPDSDSEVETPRPNSAKRVGSDVINFNTNTGPQSTKQLSAIFNSDAGEEEEIQRELKDAEDEVLSIQLKQAQRRVADVKNRLEAWRGKNVKI